MNYWKRHIGDYARDTAHLSQGQVGAYDLLLDWYYANERPLPSDPEDVYRITRAFTKDERKNAAKARAFFDADGRHKRCDEEIAARRKQAETNREIGKLGGRPKVNGNRIGFDSDTEIEPNDNPSHKPLTSKEQEISTAIAVEGKTDVLPNCPVQGIVELYHQLLPELPRIRKLTKGRADQIRARWREDLTDLDDWRAYFSQHVKPSEFLTGRSPPTPGRKIFRADLAWLTKAENFAKVIEGKYRG